MKPSTENSSQHQCVFISLILSFTATLTKVGPTTTEKSKVSTPYKSARDFDWDHHMSQEGKCKNKNTLIYIIVKCYSLTVIYTRLYGEVDKIFIRNTVSYQITFSKMTIH